MGRLYDLAGRFDRGHEPERTLAPQQIVVDRFGDADDADLQTAPFDFGGEGGGAA